MYEIDFYEDQHSNSELRNFLQTLNQSHRKEDLVLLKKITFQLELLAQVGPQLREPQAKFLKGYQYPIMELRPMPERIFYARWHDNHFILLSHYTKRQNKTDRREVLRAIRLYEDWIERNGQ
ncbi:type II toxin-antitoxin system RelE/ParE family toxin [Lentilactobacillus farraginis]|uniref:Type II toxin-antitoxin system RelE/ParE family toxin n=2 Tax=Lentilactobacillus farraginis DSM 18382 = JCM 14108 TaxID=1423743 RepID=A0A0R1VEE5_9LACO|nr:type II toxin-antitoxin system RelE/ParE family toxin [Lentilactobacillus farraginis]KRM02068.1 hypothetical protein FD41_GL001267 [Lentilactobacillus farraginis DSM 18382 = JCM 14108]